MKEIVADDRDIYNVSFASNGVFREYVIAVQAISDNIGIFASKYARSCPGGKFHEIGGNINLSFCDYLLFQ